MRGLVVTVIGLMVMLLVGIIVVQALISSQSQAGWSEPANETWTTLQANIWTAFTLMVIIPIIIGAVAILAYLKFGGK